MDETNNQLPPPPILPRSSNISGNHLISNDRYKWHETRNHYWHTSSKWCTLYYLGIYDETKLGRSNCVCVCVCQNVGYKLEANTWNIYRQHGGHFGSSSSSSSYTGKWIIMDLKPHVFLYIHIHMYTYKDVAGAGPNTDQRTCFACIDVSLRWAHWNLTHLRVE